jgi:hypothetical protein
VLAIVLSRPNSNRGFQTSMTDVSKSMPAHYLEGIEAMNKDDIIDAESNPFEFLSPQLKKMTAHSAHKFYLTRELQLRKLKQYSKREEAILSSHSRAELLGNLLDSSFEYQLCLSQLSSSLKNVVKFNGKTGKAGTIIDDIKELIERVTVIRDWNREQLELQRDELNRHVSNLAIIESKKSIELANLSIEQAVSVKRQYPRFVHIQRDFCSLPLYQDLRNWLSSLYHYPSYHLYSV